VTKYHWTGVLFVLLIGYFLAIWFPGPGMAVKGKLGL